MIHASPTLWMSPCRMKMLPPCRSLSCCTSTATSGRTFWLGPSVPSLTELCNHCLPSSSPRSSPYVPPSICETQRLFYSDMMQHLSGVDRNSRFFHISGVCRTRSRDYQAKIFILLFDVCCYRSCNFHHHVSTGMTNTHACWCIFIYSRRFTALKVRFLWKYTYLISCWDRW